MNETIISPMSSPFSINRIHLVLGTTKNFMPRTPALRKLLLDVLTQNPAHPFHLGCSLFSGFPEIFMLYSSPSLSTKNALNIQFLYITLI